MLLLITTTISGQERKKKLVLSSEKPSTAEVQKATEELFKDEPELRGLQRMEIFDTDFNEWVDCDASTAYPDKSKVRVVFKQKEDVPTIKGSADEKDKLIDQLKTRLGHLETNLKILSTRKAESESMSQRSATSDLRKKKAEEKHAPVMSDSMRSPGAFDSESLLFNAREERRKQKRQDNADMPTC
ncbi:hypothetical protein DIPPA_07586 [Diplonema papillatum]|nr:hypothetical protein DIPPA_07586 [Diplonema papillatum]